MFLSNHGFQTEKLVQTIFQVCWTQLDHADHARKNVGFGIYYQSVDGVLWKQNIEIIHLILT